MVWVIMRGNRGLCTDLLAFALQLRKTPENLRLSDEDRVTSHRIRWDPLPPNDVGVITERVRDRGKERRKDGRVNP